MDTSDVMCAVCGAHRSANQEWFLVAQSRWQDRLRILQWDDRLALQNGVHGACRIAHVQELVVHWMATANLEFAVTVNSAGQKRQGRGRGARPAAEMASFGVSGERVLGELAVHRESLTRVLHENPESLVPVLDALLCALNRRTGRTASQSASEFARCEM